MIKVWEMQMFSLGIILYNWIEVSQWTVYVTLSQHSTATAVPD